MKTLETILDLSIHSTLSTRQRNREELNTNTESENKTNANINQEGTDKGKELNNISSIKTLKQEKTIQLKDKTIL